MTKIGKGAKKNVTLKLDKEQKGKGVFEKGK